MPIEEIKIGDKVWAYNEANQSKSLQEVTHLIRGEHYKELIDIELTSGEIITSTDNHPFWTIDTQSWIEADELTNRSILLNINDKNTTIKSLKHYAKNKKVYNLTVGNVHTYYVGLGGVLGSNDTPPTLPPSTIIKQDGLLLWHNYGNESNMGGHEHPPIHFHVKYKNKEYRVLPNGKPVGNSKPLPKKAQEIVDNKKSRLRQIESRIGRWYKFINC